MSRLLTAGLWVLGLAAVLAPPALAQEGWGDWDWWDQTTPTAVQERLDHGADLTARTPLGQTPLHRAVLSNDNPAVAALLLDHGADPIARDRDGETPLHWAAKQGTPAIVAVLLDRGADATLRDNQNKLPADYGRREQGPPGHRCVPAAHRREFLSRWPGSQS